VQSVELTTSAMIAVCLNCGDCSDIKRRVKIFKVSEAVIEYQAVMLSLFDTIVKSPHILKSKSAQM
jgi:hypothetical protein